MKNSVFTLDRWDIEAQQYKEEQANYERLFSMLLMSGEYREQDIDAQVHEIMDNPHIYPEYF